MSYISREEMQARLEAAEARTDTKLAEISGKIDRIGFVSAMAKSLGMKGFRLLLPINPLRSAPWRWPRPRAVRIPRRRLRPQP